jgi:hypothetical protein
MYFHSTLWVTQRYFDWTSRAGPSRRGILHVSKTLALLQRRLIPGDHEPITDITIAVVVALVLTTALVGNLKTAITHMAGLSRMVSIRGGVRALQSNMQLQLKACRADLCIDIITGRPPHFFRTTDIKWARFIADEDEERWGLPTTLSALPIDSKLADL